PAVLPRCGPSSTRSPPPGPVGVAGFRHHRAALAEASTAFHAGVHELLLIALPWRWRSSWATGRAGRYRRRGHGRHEELAPTSICRARSGGSRPTPGVAGSRWAVVGAGSRRRGGAGGADQRRQRTASSLAAPLSYGALRYLNPTWSWPGRIRRSGSTTWAPGRGGRGIR
ncbi:linear gramicidin synthetase subunit D domain protein, partial [Mycobacterium xenopi 4042]